MKRENEESRPQQTSDHPGSQPVAKNPNPRANENIRDQAGKTEKESAGIEDEVGSEITDGEDA